MRTILILALLATPVFAGPPEIYADDGTYLGNMSANQFDRDSINNPVGRYGSSVSPDSINNPVGRYGSSVSPDSVNNPYARSRREAPDIEGLFYPD